MVVVNLTLEDNKQEMEISFVFFRVEITGNIFFFFS